MMCCLSWNCLIIMWCYAGTWTPFNPETVRLMIGELFRYSDSWWCCKGDELFIWERPFFTVLQIRNPWTDFQKHNWLCRRHDLACKFGGQSVLRGVSVHAWSIFFVTFYHAMHYGFATLSRLSVCPSVMLLYHGHIGCFSSKLLTRVIRLGSLLLRAPTLAI